MSATDDDEAARIDGGSGAATDPTRRAGRGRWVVGGVALGLFTLFTVAFLIAEALGLESEATWRAWLTPLTEGYGAVATAAVLAGALVVDLALPVPSSVVMTLSGGLLGAVGGAVVNVVGAMGAAWLGWGLCRVFGEGAFARLIGDDLPSVRAWFRRWGSWVIVLSRAVPMLTEVVSCLAGLHGMSFGRFTVLSLAGTVPISVVYAVAGAWGVESLWVPVVVALGLPAVGYGVVRRVVRPHAAEAS